MTITSVLTTNGYVLADSGNQSPVLGALLATDGNSLIGLAGPPLTDTLSPTTDASFVNWGLAYSEQRMRWVEQRAISGQTTNQQRDRLRTWVPNTAANHLLFLEGINAIAGYVAAGATDLQAAQLAWIDLVAYLNEARGYGKFRRIFLATIPPRGTSAARNAAHEYYNRQIRNLCASDGFFKLMDFWAVTVDPTSLTGSAKANYLRADDQLHPTPKGCRAMGKEFARVINEMLLPNSNFFPTSSVVRSISATANIINSNPLFLGTTGGELLNGATGNVAPGWKAGMDSGSGTAVASIVAAPDGFGQAQRLVISGAANNAIAAIKINHTEALPYQVANDWFKAFAKVTWSGATNVKAIYMQMSGVTSGAYQLPGFASTSATAAVADYDNADMTDAFGMVTPANKFPGGVAVNTVLDMGVYVLFGAASGAITLNVARAGLFNLGQNVAEF